MIIDISNLEFKNLWEDEKLFLPIRWDGYDFLQTLNGLFDYYIKKLDLLPNNGYVFPFAKGSILSICKELYVLVAIPSS